MKIGPRDNGWYLDQFRFFQLSKDGFAPWCRLRVELNFDRYLLIDHDGVRLCLRTADTNWPIVHPPGYMWSWRAMVMIIPAEDNSWLVYQGSLAVLPAETSTDIYTHSFSYTLDKLSCIKLNLILCTKNVISRSLQKKQTIEANSVARVSIGNSIFICL
jgi:hypothetical protein